MNHQDEFEFARKLARVLDGGTQQVTPAIRSKLQEARRQALARQRAAHRGLRLAAVGYFTSDVLLPHARAIAATLALVIGVAVTYTWNNFQKAAENVEIDSALLVDELPINAYLDRGFRAWLEHSSQAQQE